MKRIEIAKLYENASAYASEPVKVCGWIRTNRDSKALGFMEINDGSCFKGVQVVFEADKLENFAETAKLVMKEFVSNFEIGKFADYFKLFKDGAEQHILNMWMADPEEQKIIEEAGVSGKLNDDPENPVAGVYFSLADASKLGWYVDIIPEVSEPVINEDNSRTYDVKITLNNIMSDEEQEKINWYIIGAYNGDIRSFIHCFAPAGGTITDVETSNGMYMLESVYHDLQVAYNLDVLIGRGDPIEITYKITTAPGVETPLKVVTTPTLTQYRLPEDYGPIGGEDDYEEDWN